jgi:UDP-glucose 4-epimerase
VKLRVVAVGRDRSGLYAPAIDEYAKRIARYVKFDVVEVPEARKFAGTPQARDEEAASLTAKLGQRERLDVFGTDYPTPDGTCIRDYIHVSDLARAHLAALLHLRSDGDSTTLNCAYGHGYSVLEVIEAVKRAAGRDFPVRMVPRRPGDPMSIVATGERIRQVLGWKPQFDDLDTIVRHALAWERRLVEKGRPVREAISA